MKAKSNVKFLMGLITMLLIFGTSMVISCEKDEPKLTRSHRKIVDSLVQKRTVEDRPILDSLCDLRMAEELTAVTDSIVEERMIEIRRKIDANAKTN